MRLEALQQAMIGAIDNGPDFIMAEAFAGGREAALRGLAVHANTISHARLVALEETFPRTRALIGEARFNALSRDYVERSDAACEPLDSIGRHFPAALAEQYEPDEAVALAAFEWAWLESYHAAEAEPLTLETFAGMNETKVLETVVALHPATRLAPAGAGAALEAEVPGITATAAILITRPEADVLVFPADEATVALLESLSRPQPVCNLLTVCGEQAAEDGLRVLLALVRAGSLVLTP